MIKWILQKIVGIGTDLLDQLGIVPALDEDPAGQGGAGAIVGHRERTGCRTRASRRLRDSRNQAHRLAVDHEPAAQREAAPPTFPVLEFDHPGFHPRDRTAVAVLRDLDDEILRSGHLGRRGEAFLTPSGGEHIRTVSVVHAFQGMRLRYGRTAIGPCVLSRVGPCA